MICMHFADSILEIRCPRCRGLARFEDPYEFIGVPTPKANSPLRQLPRYGTWFVREKFPSLFPWKGSDQYAKQLHACFRDALRPGVALCSHCGEVVSTDCDGPRMHSGNGKSAARCSGLSLADTQSFFGISSTGRIASPRTSRQSLLVSWLGYLQRFFERRCAG